MSRPRYSVRLLGDLFETIVLFRSCSLKKALDYYQQHCTPASLSSYQQYSLIDVKEGLTLGYVTSSGVGWYDGDSKFEFHHASKETQKPAQQSGGTEGS